MSSIKQLTANQLSKMLTETQAELKRRENIDKARKAIQAVLKKYKIAIDDLNLGVSYKKPVRKKAAAKKGTEKKLKAKKAAAKKRAAKASQEASALQSPQNTITQQPVTNGLAAGARHFG